MSIHDRRTVEAVRQSGFVKREEFWIMAVSIAVDMGKRLAPVAPELYGGLIEHLGRNVYGGIYDPSDPTPMPTVFGRMFWKPSVNLICR